MERTLRKAIVELRFEGSVSLVRLGGLCIRGELAGRGCLGVSGVKECLVEFGGGEKGDCWRQ